MLIQVASATEGGAPRFIERDQLEITHHMRWLHSSFEHAIEYCLDGKLVRRDVWVNILRGAVAATEQGNVGG